MRLTTVSGLSSLLAGQDKLVLIFTLSLFEAIDARLIAVRHSLRNEKEIAGWF